MSALTWRIATPEEVVESEAAQARQPERRAPQMRCLCGRFVKANTHWRHGPDQIGMSMWGWHCTRCGDMIERT